MKDKKHTRWGLVALWAALALAPVAAYAHDTEPVARTKPVIDHAYPAKRVSHAARDHHEAHHQDAHHHRQCAPKQVRD